MKTKQKAVRRILPVTSVPPLDLSPDIQETDYLPSSSKRKQSASTSFGCHATTENVRKKICNEVGQKTVYLDSSVTPEKDTTAHDPQKLSTAAFKGNYYHLCLYVFILCLFSLTNLSSAFPMYTNMLQLIWVMIKC